MERILVPLDGSQLSEKILTHIETLAQRTNAKIIMLQVVPFFWPSEFKHVREMGDKMDKEAADYLFVRNARLGEKGIKGEVCVCKGHVPEAICDFGREKMVDLIAMSTHGRGGIKRWALGSVANKVIQTSSVPLLLYNIAGEKVTPSHYQNVLIPVDGSLFSENVFPQAKKVVELFHAKVWFLYVINTHLMESFTVLGDNISEKELTENIQNYFSTLKTRLKETKATNYEVVIKKGDPAETICNFAEENEIDLIAMSTHGRGGITRWSLGSVTDKVVRGSTKPVLLIRAVGENRTKQT